MYTHFVNTTILIALVLSYIYIYFYTSIYINTKECNYIYAYILAKTNHHHQDPHRPY